MMNKGYGVQVTVTSAGLRNSVPVVVVARNEREAELIASAAAEGEVQTDTIRELSHEEAASYGLDLAQHGQTKALPVLNL
jgi:hypothetical protein